MPDQEYKHHLAAFTLTELIVVVGIISLIIGLTFPMMRMMTRSSSSQMGVNTVSIAIQATQSYSFKDDNVPFLKSDLYPNPGVQPSARAADSFSENGSFSGYAAMFTPTGRIVFMANDLGAATTETLSARTAAGEPFVLSLELRGPGIGTNTLERRTYSHVGPTSVDKYEMRRLNGFKSISGNTNNSLDPLELPKDTGVCGILMPISNQKPVLIPPPFVVWYDKGTLFITLPYSASGNGPTDYSYVYINEGTPINADSYKYYELDRARPAGYNPYLFDQNDELFDSTRLNPATERPYLPFEKVEAVIGVFTYSKTDFREATSEGSEQYDAGLRDWGQGNPLNSADNNLRWEWMKKNGRMIMFSKQSGNSLRSEAQ
ncbi:type II secretion system protein [Poriferisphaera corsica]|nr:type II secretion system protein [Poriferisphaera corsica]